MSQFFLKKQKNTNPVVSAKCLLQHGRLWKHHGADSTAVPTVQSQSGSEHQETLYERISSFPLAAQPN